MRRGDHLAVRRVQIGGDSFLDIAPAEEPRQFVHQTLFVEGSTDVAEITAHQVEEGPVRKGDERRFPIRYRPPRGDSHESSSSVQCWIEYLYPCSARNFCRFAANSSSTVYRAT